MDTHDDRPETALPEVGRGTPAPGWYPDPGGGWGLRWWDGARWTDQVAMPTIPPAKEAAEVIRLNQVIRDLSVEIEAASAARTKAAERLKALQLQQIETAAEMAAADRTYTAAVDRCYSAQLMRDAVAARVSARAAAEQGTAQAAAQAAARAAKLQPPAVQAPQPATQGPPLGVPPAAPRAAPRDAGAAPQTSPGAATRAPETSTRAVQNLLFVVGGLLLSAAAVVFVAVAWVSYGNIGRAVILGVVTLLVLAIPPAALWRRLRATAETFAALGLLLVLLDGYAAWFANLAGLRSDIDVATFAAVVCAVTAALALGYGTATRLVGPRIIGPLVAQPVLPLLAAESGFGLTGWAVVFTAVAAGNLALVWRAKRRNPASIAVIEGWLFMGLASGVAAILALAAVVSSDVPAAAARAGASLVLVAAVLVAASLVAGVQTLHQVAGALMVVALFVAGAQITDVSWPGLGGVLIAALPMVLAIGVVALPQDVRTGPRVGAFIAAGLPGSLIGLAALVAGAVTARLGLPAWRAEPVGFHERLAYFDWQLPVAVVLITVAVGLLLPRRAAVDAAVVGAVALALTVPASFPLPWWATSIVDGVFVVPFALMSLRGRSAVRAAILFGAAGVLAVHAVVAGLARPTSTAAVLGALVVLTTIVAALGQLGSAHTSTVYRGDTAPGGRAAAQRLARLAPPWHTRTAIGALAALVGLVALPGLAAAIGELAAGNPPLTRFCAALGLATAAVLVAALRQWWPEYALAGVGAVVLAGPVVAFAAVRTPQFAVYAAVVFGLDVAVGLAVLPALRRDETQRYAPASLLFAGLAALPLISATVAVAPAVWTVLFPPYSWLDSIWSGAPAGVGLAPSEADRVSYPFGGDAIALAVLAVTAAAGRYGWASGTGRRRALASAARWAAIPAGLAGLVLAAALGARWPTVAALSLAVGVACSLTAALRRSTGDTAMLAGFGALTTGAGLAGSLAMKPTTLGALSVVVVAAAVAGVAGRTVGARTAGWLVGVAGAATLALAAQLAADIAVRWAAFGVLAIGAAALGLSALLRRRSIEARVVEGAAHATALAALLLTTGSVRHTAGVLTLWGIAIGLRALRSGESVEARRVRIVVGVACELVAYWLVLVASQVALLEAYTVPAAALAVLAGWLAARSQLELRSWLAYGPALLAGFGPSLSTILVVEGAPLRRLVLGTAAVAIVVAGSVRRLLAPVVVGGVVVVVVALHETVLVWDLLPRWIPLLVAGLVLVGLASTYERRRRDLARLTGAMGRMR